MSEAHVNSHASEHVAHDGGNLLDIGDLSVTFRMSGGNIHAVQHVSFTLLRNETLGLVGESGCGKSTTAMTIMGLLPQSTRVSGRVELEGQNLLAMSRRDLRALRGDRVSMIFQNPMSSLDPAYTAGSQIVDVLQEHRGLSRAAAKTEAIALLRQVRVDSPEERFDTYPHHMSGGMRQRVVIAIALACDPALLIADEPTTALDVTIQAQILNLLQDLRAERQTSIILITHDLGVVAQMADRIAVMYAGRVVEEGPVTSVFEEPLHPYTAALMRSIPAPEVKRGTLEVIEGTVPSLREPARACSFAPRCRHRMERCTQLVPALTDVQPNHKVACFLHEDAHE
ncbi:MAG: ABC transporter ATP-binding protein [Acidobacteriaceae bacterium]